MSYQTINPSNEEKVKVFHEHTDEQLEELIARAQSTYQNDWSRRTLAERKAVLKNAASILRQKRSDFARLLTLEMGKLLQEAGGEVDLSADILDYYADNAEKFLAPKQLKVDEGEAIVEGRLNNAGECCIAPKRFILDEKIADVFNWQMTLRT